MSKIGNKIYGVVDLRLNDRFGTWVLVVNPAFYMENKKKYFTGFQIDRAGCHKDVTYELHPSKNNYVIRPRDYTRKNSSMEDIFYDFEKNIQ